MKLRDVCLGVVLGGGIVALAFIIKSKMPDTTDADRMRARYESITSKEFRNQRNGPRHPIAN